MDLHCGNLNTVGSQKRKTFLNILVDGCSIDELFCPRILCQIKQKITEMQEQNEKDFFKCNIDHKNLALLCPCCQNNLI